MFPTLCPEVPAPMPLDNLMTSGPQLCGVPVDQLENQHVGEVEWGVIGPLAGDSSAQK